MENTAIRRQVGARDFPTTVIPEVSVTAVLPGNGHNQSYPWPGLGPGFKWRYAKKYSNRPDQSRPKRVKMAGQYSQETPKEATGLVIVTVMARH